MQDTLFVAFGILIYDVGNRMIKDKHLYHPQIIASFIGILLIGLTIVTYISNHSLVNSANYFALSENKLKYFTATYSLIILTSLTLWFLKRAFKFTNF